VRQQAKLIRKRSGVRRGGQASSESNVASLIPNCGTRRPWRCRFPSARARAQPSKGSESLTRLEDMDSSKGSESLTHLEDMDSAPLTGQRCTSPTMGPSRRGPRLVCHAPARRAVQREFFGGGGAARDRPRATAGADRGRTPLGDPAPANSRGRSPSMPGLPRRRPAIAP
jgi:hypothetical protein